MRTPTTDGVIRPDDPAFGWSGEHALAFDGHEHIYRCACGRSDWPDADSVRSHIEWALRQQNEALWNAGQRVCNGNEGAVENLGRMLDLCRPSS
jgi:hypothetical protein